MSKYLIKLNSKFITTKWWSQKWCNNISQYADFYNRLERGRTYLRKGTVQDLVVEGGKVTASVVGSGITPYQVVIYIKPLPKDKAKEALKNLHNISEFQHGRVSLDEKYLFSMDKNGLFPTLDEIEFSCTCPDWASLCKHGAAVLYAIGSILDQEPLVLFQLRGIDVDAYLETSLLEKTNTLLSNIYNSNDRTIDESMISDIFGIELGSLSIAPTSDGEIDDTPKTTDIVRVIEIKPSTSTIPILNEMYAKDCSRKIKAVVKAKGNSGKHISSFPPFGYIKSPEDKEKWIVDEEAALIVKEIFNLCIKGYGPSQIARILTERGIETPTMYFHRKGIPTPGKIKQDSDIWAMQSVAHILENEEYLGRTVNF